MNIETKADLVTYLDSIISQPIGDEELESLADVLCDEYGSGNWAGTWQRVYEAVQEMSDEEFGEYELLVVRASATAKVCTDLEGHFTRLHVDHKHVGRSAFTYDVLDCGCIRIGDDWASVAAPAGNILARLGSLSDGAGTEDTWDAFRDLDEGNDCPHGN